MFSTYLPNENVRAVTRARQRYSQFIFYFDNEMFYIFSKKFKLHMLRTGVMSGRGKGPKKSMFLTTNLHAQELRVFQSYLTSKLQCRHSRTWVFLKLENEIYGRPISRSYWLILMITQLKFLKYLEAFFLRCQNVYVSLEMDQITIIFQWWFCYGNESMRIYIL